MSSGRPVFPFFARITFCFLCGLILSGAIDFSLPWGVGVLPLLIVGYAMKSHWVLYPAAFLLSFFPQTPAASSGLMSSDEAQAWIVSIPDSKGVKRSAGFIRAARTDSAWHFGEQSVMVFAPDSLPAGRLHLVVTSGSLSYNEKYPDPAFFIREYAVDNQSESNSSGMKGLAANRLLDVLDSANQGIALGLFLGDKSRLDQETYALFRRSGGAHVLAVSGLHVGIVYGILYFLTLRAGNRRLVRYARALLIILVLWGYAAITGFSPSVIRAAGFFTVFAIGTWRQTTIPLSHSLVLLLFLVAVLAPAQLQSVGLQLSYLAVGGIMIFQPVFEKRLRHWRNPYQWFGRAVTVSISAQLLTLPVLVHYFGGFSLLGAVSSIILIPYAFCGLLLSMIVFILGDLIPIRYLVNLLFEFITNGVTGTMERMASHPLAYSEVDLTALEITLYYFILLMLYVSIQRPGKRIILVLMSGLLNLVVSY